jgi:hypothetical protein
MEQKKIVSWDSVVEKSSEFVEFEDGVRRTYVITNWQLFETEQTSYKDKTIKEITTKFTADVVAISDEKSQNIKKTKELIGTTSKRLILALKPHLIGKEPTSIIFLSIKRLGTQTATSYDVELREPVALVD